MKILFFQTILPHYRIEFFSRLNELLDADIYIAHSGKPTLNQIKTNLNEILLPPQKIGPFLYQKGYNLIINKIKPDICILPFDPHCLSFFLPLIRSKEKYGYFGIGLGKSKIANLLRLKVIKKNSVLLYSKEEFIKINNLINNFKYAKNLNFFQNTIYVDVFTKKKNNDYFLFVGSLNKRKDLPSILLAFYMLFSIAPKTKLVIVGSGSMEKNLKLLAQKLKLINSIDFLGTIEDRSELANIYSNAIATLHYGQAGLSVLQSLGHGVPCILNSSAISGGEKEAVLNNHNGLVVSPGISNFSSAMFQLIENKELQERLSLNAKKYYLENCTIDLMALSFKKMILDTIKKQ